MVDINLFDDEPEDENIGQGDPSFDSLDDTGGLDLGDDLGGEETIGGGLDVEDLGGDFGEGLSEESIDDALGFDDDLSDTGNLGEEGLIGEDLSDLDDEEVSSDDEDYDFSGGGRKKASPLLILILVAIGIIALYMTYGNSIKTLLMPEKKTIARSRTGTTQRQSIAAKQQGTTTPGTVPADTSQKVTPGIQSAGASFSPLISATTKIFNDLSSQGQFAMVIVEQDRFTTEYASPTKGVSDNFGKRLQNLVGATSYLASPEDMHNANGKTVYLGVISGKFDPSKMTGQPFSSPFATEEAFLNTLNSIIQQQNLSKTGINKRSTKTVGTQKEITYEVILGGEKTKAMAFLQSLNTHSKGCKPVKISISPKDQNDFNATQVKMVLNIKVSVGSVQGTASKPAM